MAAIVSPLEIQTVVITAGLTSSGPLLVKNPGALGLLVPVLTSTTMKLQASADGVLFVDLHDAAGNPLLAYPAGTGSFALSSVDLAALAGYASFQVVLGTAQGADRSFTLTRVLERTDPLV